MYNNDYEKIFWDLFNSDSELEVNKVVNDYSKLFNVDDNWHPYGDDDANLKTFTNQQDNSIQPLTEKIVNSLDAILIKQCETKGYSPEDSNNPKSMKGAVSKFFNIKDGELMHLTESERRSQANRIQIIATGNRYKRDLPINEMASLLIYDDGTGQNHKNFKDSFLSINGSNKVNIPFVQGKYNMGSTGSVIFCGSKHYQLIGSLHFKDDKKEFGYTLIRKHILKNDEINRKMTWYEYFRPNGEIPFFKINKEIDLGLHNRNFKSGSIVKLYSYQLPAGVRGNVSTDLYRELNQFMYDLPLPFLVKDNRNYKNEIDNKIILGNRNRLNDGKHLRDSISFELDLNNFKIPGQVFILNNDDPREFIGTKSFYKSLQFIINGQVHHHKGRTFINQDLGFGFLYKYAFVVLDFTNVDTNIKSDLFMANRTNVLKGELYDRIEEELVNTLRYNDKLKEINEDIRRSISSKSRSAEDQITEFMKKFPSNKTVSQLLEMTELFGFNFGNSRKKSDEEKNSKKASLNRFPSIFKIRPNRKGEKYKAIPLNSKGHIEIETDVTDDYLFRHHEKGKMEIEVLQRRYTENNGPRPGPPGPAFIPTDKVTVNFSGPDNGKIRLIVKPNKKAKVGDEIEIRANLSKNGQVDNQSLEVKFDVRISPEIIKSENSKTKKDKNNGLRYPKPVPVYEDKIEEGVTSWDDLDWNSKDIIQVSIGQAEDDRKKNVPVEIYINVDSSIIKGYINKYRSKLNNKNKIEYVKDCYFMTMYLNGLFEWISLSRMQIEKDDTVIDMDIEKHMSEKIKHQGQFLLYEKMNINEFELVND